MNRKEIKKRRSGIKIMGSLIGLVKPLMHVMAFAVILGVAGYLCAIFLTILAAGALTDGLIAAGAGNGIAVTKIFAGTPAAAILTVMIVIAVLRGILHYGEQACNHYIAFKLLALIRHKVFSVLRRLAPAKLEGRDKGNLISILTTDIELLEVFYAHTISPIAIAVLTSLVMIVFIGQFHILAALLALVAYMIVGLILPLVNGKKGAQEGMAFRNEFGDMNSFVLDSLRGLDETIQYDCGEERNSEMKARSRRLARLQKKLNAHEQGQRSVTNLCILLFSFGMLFMMLFLYENGKVGFDGVLIPVVAMMSSFGPVAALSSLSNNLNQTLASGERVLSLLEEKPQVEEITGMQTIKFYDAGAQRVSFAYDDEKILDDISVEIPNGKIIGIHGKSGSGKSTLLKLFMRFWNADSGKIIISDKNIQEINTADLRDMQSYVTQETHLFHDSVAENIAVGRPGASMEDIIAAAKQASLHDFVSSLPKGYDTPVGELGDGLSGGERQRIGIARAFLHDAPFLLLDEPTSNLDALNEGVILKSLKETCGKKTVVLVSHQKSTMKIADTVFKMKDGRQS